MCVNVGVNPTQRSEVRSYRGYAVDQSVDIRWQQEADLLQQVAVFPEHRSDLQTHSC